MEKGFSKQDSQIISSTPRTFMWDSVFSFLVNVAESTSSEWVRVFSKFKIFSNPGREVSHFHSLCSQRPIFKECPLEIESTLTIPLPAVNMGLELLKALDASIIRKVLIQTKSEQWVSEAKTHSKFQEKTHSVRYHDLL